MNELNKKDASGSLSKQGASKQLIGKIGEDAAADFLLHAGYTIQHRNWRVKSGEIDIIALHDNTIVFVEVRTRRAGGRFGTAVESVDWRKQQQVRSTAEVYLKSRANTTQQSKRFDVIAITLDGANNIRELKHIDNAF